jgi:nitrite reductase/ring-hydroxylating ferredoxin subunit
MKETVGENQSQATTRREVLARVALGVCGITTVLAVWGGFRFLTPRISSRFQKKIPVGRVNDFQGSACFFIPESKLFIVRRNREMRAVTAVCTHLGCTLQQGPDGFRCSCHGSRFDLAGQVLAGPAPRPLTWYRLTMDNQGRIYVHLDDEVEYESRLEI